MGTGPPSGAMRIAGRQEREVARPGVLDSCDVSDFGVRVAFELAAEFCGYFSKFHADSPSRPHCILVFGGRSVQKSAPPNESGCEKVRFVTIRKMEGIERIGLIVISNRGVTIRFWKLIARGSKLKKSDNSARKIVENLRLEIFSLQILMAFTHKVNRGFAIRNLNGSDRGASAIRWMIGLATAHRQECLCHRHRLASRVRLEALLRHLCGAE
jgi:hypothetical protein